MGRFFSRLRWQLTLSHLLANAFTLASLVAIAVALVLLLLSIGDRPETRPAQNALIVGRSVTGLIVAGEHEELNVVLRALADGRLNLVGAGPAFAPSEQRARAQARFGPPLQNVAYIVVLGPDGQPIASSDPAGAAFSPPERDEWRAIADRALAGQRDPAALYVVREGLPAAFGAYPVLDDREQVVAAVVVAMNTLPAPESFFDNLVALIIFGAAAVAILSVAAVFALASSFVIAYLLSRRLVSRLERLGKAAEALAAGDLSWRVEEGADDEVGQLARRFNSMASDLDRLLSELRVERDRVAGLLEARRQLVASVSHELRTPVATIRGYLESALQRSEALPKPLASDLETIEREIERLQHLIEDLFTLSRAEVGKLELRPEPIDAGRVVQRVVETAAPLAWQQRRVEVLAEIPPALPPMLADAQRLEQIVSNLLSNAVRHTPPGGLVAAAVRPEAEMIRVDIRDTGEGIASEDLPRVFERFYRGRGADGRGAGLGLALARELTEAMGGTISATSTPGEGSAFTIRIPRA